MGITDLCDQYHASWAKRRKRNSVRMTSLFDNPHCSCCPAMISILIRSTCASSSGLLRPSVVGMIHCSPLLPSSSQIGNHSELHPAWPDTNTAEQFLVSNEQYKVAARLSHLGNTAGKIEVASAAISVASSCPVNARAANVFRSLRNRPCSPHTGAAACPRTPSESIE